MGAINDAYLLVYINPTLIGRYGDHLTIPCRLAPRVRVMPLVNHASFPAIFNHVIN